MLGIQFDVPHVARVPIGKLKLNWQVNIPISIEEHYDATNGVFE